ncbi:MAG: hypothetical protein KAV83_04115 [Desulfobacterales bacterium]|nr:hypothetical protein [Desulfobacterales bacterium]
MVEIEAEEQRIRATYASRDATGKPTLYAWHRPEVLFSQYRFRAIAASMLVANGLSDLSKLELLDVGCGTGGQRSEVRDQRSEVRGQRSEVRGQRTAGWLDGKCLDASARKALAQRDAACP